MGESIIPFYGLRRGAARIETGGEGTAVTLSLRPAEGKDPPEPAAALLASAAGEKVRIPLEKGKGRSEKRIEPALLLLCAAAETGEEHIVAEGIRSGTDRRQAERLKESLRALRLERRQEGEKPARKMPEQVPAKEKEAAEGSAALREILARAERLFPEGLEGEGLFAADAPFVPRPAAEKKKPQRPEPAPCLDPAWQAAVREMEKGMKLTGVGRAAGEAEVLFPLDFPGVAFRRVSWPGSRRYYLEGRGTWQGKPVVIHALPGEARGGAPFSRCGFHRFVRDKRGAGYWIRVTGR